MCVSFVFFGGVGKRTERCTYELTSVESIPEAYWKELARMKIFFGHQSVGQDLIEGVIDVMAEHPEIELKIVESADPASIEEPAFIHHTVGRNARPNSNVGFREGQFDGRSVFR